MACALEALLRHRGPRSSESEDVGIVRRVLSVSSCSTGWRAISTSWAMPIPHRRASAAITWFLLVTPSAQNGAGMNLHGTERQTGLAHDLLIAPTFDQKAEHVDLARREPKRVTVGASVSSDGVVRHHNIS